MIPAPTGNRALGYFGIISAVLIWAGWIVATREAVTREYAPLDLAILRYGTPAILLAPIWLRRGLFPKGESPLLLLIMTVGWGGPFVFFVSNGLQTIEASLFGPLVPGMLPMVVTFWGVFVAGERLTPMRSLGVAFIAAAVAFILVPAVLAGDSGFLSGAPWLFAACIGWSSFTIAYRRTTLSGLEAAAYVCLYSCPIIFIAALVVGTNLPQIPLADIALQSLIQGVISGLASVVGYAYAVKTLGLAPASAFTSLVPAFAALGGWLILGEEVGPMGWAAALAASIGVLLVNRAVTQGAKA